MPRGQRHGPVERGALDEGGDDVERPVIAHQMQVVQHDDRRFAEAVDGSHQLPHAVRLRPAAQLRQPHQCLVLRWVDPIQCEREIGEQHRRIVITVVERDPSCRARVELRPGPQERRLPVAWAGDDAHDVRAGPLDTRKEPDSWDRVQVRLRKGEAGGGRPGASASRIRAVRSSPIARRRSPGHARMLLRLNRPPLMGRRGRE